ncbi:MAG TPA: thiamine pyrophosphate-binding protein [Gaiellaceae bacterium]|jgi:thiamine pyrophosphate-dependent acetolactate synthase large subunit-like protein|nr:thiamine pyrophosphate-binding protein [Gaiellaceae bacterium]
MSTVARAIARTLVAGGVDTVFGVIGSGNFLLANELRDAGATFYAARHECGAMMMADGYGRVSGRVAVCTTHQGPGYTNALTGLVEAAKARTPAILLTADTPAATLWSNFKVGQAAIARECGAIAELVSSPETAVEDAARALHRTVAERLPVVLNVPVDLPAREGAGGEAPARPGVPLPAPAPGDVEAVAALLEAASFPVFVAGRGAVVSPGARDAIESLGDKAGALLVTSAMANGLFAGLPYALGIMGGLASPLCVELMQRADLVVSFGAGLNHWTVRHGNLIPPGAKVVQVDVDPEAPGRLHRCDRGVVADAAEAARAFAAALGGRRTNARTAEIAELIATRRWRDEPFDDAGTDEFVDPRALTIALDDLLPAERTVATDSGHFLGFPAEYLAVPDAAGFVFPNAFQSVGLGLGAAIGAAVARPDRLCVAALGDGGTMMALAELETAVRLGLPLLVVVYDDAAYGAEVHHFGPQGYAVDLTQFADADFAAIGRAVGAEALTVRSVGDLAPVADWLARRAAGPVAPLVLDAKVEPNVVADWLEEAFRAH